MNTYGSALQNPLTYTDPYGLFGVTDLPTLSQSFVDFSAGFGDGISFGLTGLIRDTLDIDGSKFAGNFVLLSAGALRGLAFLGGTKRGSQIPRAYSKSITN